MFAYELQRRSAAKAKTIAGPRTSGHFGHRAGPPRARLVTAQANTIYGLLFNTSERGALPTPAGRHRPDGPRRAVLRPRTVSGSCAATRSWWTSSRQSHDREIQQRWAVSEELTGVTFPV
jgi:hypothetical protein